MNAMEGYQGMTDHDLLITIATRLEEHLKECSRREAKTLMTMSIIAGGIASITSIIFGVI